MLSKCWAILHSGVPNQECIFASSLVSFFVFFLNNSLFVSLHLEKKIDNSLMSCVVYMKRQPAASYISLAQRLKTGETASMVLSELTN